jgi:hypothetical protein
VPIKLAIPLVDLVPGEYICQVTILETTGQKAAFRRDSPSRLRG